MIEICEECKGTGEITIDNGTHNSDYETHTCVDCKGSGKVEKHTFKYTIPYDSDWTLINDAQRKIFDIIQELEKTAKK